MIVVSDTSPILNLSAFGRAELLSEVYGLRVVGPLGVLAGAKDHALIPACKPLFDQIMDVAGFWIGEPLYQRFLDEIGE